MINANTVFWKVKSLVEKIPGAFPLYKYVTSHSGEGKIYHITQGPMNGVWWKRYNSLPYWYHTGLYEPQLSQYIADHLPVGGTFWDIGAHAGYHSIVAARAVGPSGQVIAVEPDPEICSIFKEQLALNKLTNCTVYQAAVADAEGEVMLMRSASDTRTSALEAVGKAGKPLPVRSTTLDCLAEDHPVPDMLKMDIEGAEILALPGGEKLLSAEKRPAHVLVGVHGDHAKSFAEEFLTRIGYRLINPPGFDERVTLVGVKACAAVLALFGVVPEAVLVY